MVLLPNYHLYFPMRNTKVIITSFLKKSLVIFADHLFYLPFARITLCYYNGYVILFYNINVKCAFYDTPVTPLLILYHSILLYFARWKINVYLYYICFESKLLYNMTISSYIYCQPHQNKLTAKPHFCGWFCSCFKSFAQYSQKSYELQIIISAHFKKIYRIDISM